MLRTSQSLLVERSACRNVIKHQQQADGETHEVQILNFLVNALTGAFGVSLCENAVLPPKISTRSSSARPPTGPRYLHSATGVKIAHLARTFSAISKQNSSLRRSKPLGIYFSGNTRSMCLHSRWRLSLISTCAPTMVMKPRQTASTTTKRKTESLRSARTLH